MISRDTIVSGANQCPAILTTNSTYPNTDFAFTNADTVANPAPADYSAYYGATSPYTASQVGGGFVLAQSYRSVKLVAAGVRVQYVDKVLDMSGDYIAWRNPNASNALDAAADTVADLLAVNAASQQRVTEGWAGSTYIPVVESDLQAYENPANYAASGGYGNPFRRLACGLFIANAQPSQRFAFEAVAFFEISGRGISTVPSHSDPATLGAILSVTAPSVEQNLPKAESQALSLFKDAISALGYAGLTLAHGVALDYAQDFMRRRR